MCYILLPVSELAEPDKGLRIVNFLLNEFSYNISSMNIYGTGSHDSLSVSFAHVSQQEVDEDIQLGHLLLVVIFQGILVPLLQSVECKVYLCRPPYLGTSKCNLLDTIASNYTCFIRNHCLYIILHCNMTMYTSLKGPPSYSTKE